MYIYICIYIYIYVCRLSTFRLCVFVCPLDTGCKLRVQQDLQKSSRVAQERFVYVQIAGCFRSRLIYLVFIIYLYISLNLIGFYCKARYKSNLNKE